MLNQLISFEWRFHTRQPSFLAAAAFFFFVGFTLTGTGFGLEKVQLTSPFLTTQTVIFASLFSVFAVAIFVANAVLRDSENRMEEIVFTTPVGKINFLAGRFCGAFAAAVTAFLFTPFGMLVALRMPWVDEARIGPVSLNAFAGSFVLALPTILFATSLLFFLATVTRSSLATYTASVVIYIFYFIVAALTNSPVMAQSKPGTGGESKLVGLLDPFGLSSFFEVTRYWTITEKNTMSVGFPTSLLINRIVWTAASLLLCAAAYRFFSFRVLSRKAGGGLWSRRNRRGPKTVLIPATSIPYRRIAASARGSRGWTPSIISSLRIEARSILTSLPFLFLLALWFILAISELRSEVFNGEYGAAYYPTTSIIVDALGLPLSIVGMLVVIYYSADIFWREQRFRIASIIDTTPIGGGTMALVKWASLLMLIIALTLTAIAAGIIIQVGSGYHEIDLLLYSSLFLSTVVPLAIYSAAAIGIHSISPGKYAGMILVLLFVVATMNAGKLGLNHPLWRFAGGASFSHSEMSGYSDSLGRFVVLMLHWAIPSAMFLAIAAVAWRRLSTSAANRIRDVLRHFLRDRVGRTAAMLVGFLVTGSWIFYGTNVRAHYQQPGELVAWKRDYERQYRALQRRDQPRLESITTAVDLYPEQRRVRIRGSYVLRNASGRPISSIHVVFRRGSFDVSVNAKGSRSTVDERFGVHRLDLTDPLTPGETISVSFDFSLDRDRSGLSAGDLSANGSLLMSFLTYPSIGYRSTYELTDPRERAKAGLGKGSTPELEDSDTLSGESIDMERTRFDAVVSTDAHQKVIVPGRLLREWIRGGRRHFHYRSDGPIRNMFVIVSGEYATSRRQVGATAVSVAHHPTHDVNVARILDTASSTLEYCSREFGNYPHAELKLVEVPDSTRLGGFAVPDTILLNERRVFQIDSRDESRIDLVGRRVAHEVAHQWWGHQLVAASRGGGTMLTESLAKYTELMMLERIHGRAHVLQLLEDELDRYLAGRADESQSERTLANSGSQPYIYYSKGALVMYAIKDLIGEKAVNLALRNLLGEHRSDATATTNDLLRHLRTVANERDFRLIDLWMRHIIIYDLSVVSASVDRRPDGRYEVKAAIQAAMLRSDESGSERAIPFDERIDVAVLRRRTAADPAIDTLLFSRVALKDGVNEIAMIVAERPMQIIVDPWLLRIDRNRSDNVRSVD